MGLRVWNNGGVIVSDSNRRSVRIPGYDYTTPGFYFVTINSSEKKPIFGVLEGSFFRPYPIGKIILDSWLQIPNHFPNTRMDEFALMPDHFHGIIELAEKNRHDINPYGHDPSLYGHDPFSYGHDISCPYEKNTEAFGHPIPGSLPTIIRTFKAAVSRQIGKPVWQPGYYEHIVRDSEDLARIRDYIATQFDRVK
jgi:putative transposase